MVESLSRCVRSRVLGAAVLSGLLLAPAAHAASSVDALTEVDAPLRWLEQLDAPEVRAWVARQNAATQARLAADPRHASLQRALHSVIDRNARALPGLDGMGDHFYWFQPPHWVRARIDSVLDPAAHGAPRIERLLDISALPRSAGRAWRFDGGDCAHTADTLRRCLLTLSPGGSDTAVVREFDLVTRRFVADGFSLPEGLHAIAWRDDDSVLVSTSVDPAGTTAAGFGRVVRLWQRGQPLAQAPIVYRGDDASTLLYPDWIWFEDRKHSLVHDTALFTVSDSQPPRRLPLPVGATLHALGETALIQLASPWQVGGRTWPVDVVLEADLAALLQGELSVRPVFEMDPGETLIELATVADGAVLVLKRDLNFRVVELKRDPAGWTRRDLPLATGDAVSVAWADTEARRYVLWRASVATPPRLELRSFDDATAPRTVLQAPALFDADGLRVERLQAISRDGTAIPYTVAFPRQRAAASPTLLTAYGGFMVSHLMAYDPAMGKGWLERGGILVHAHVRGGGEFGRAWHDAGRGHAKLRTFEDVAAVADDLIARGITRPERLGLYGASLGGLVTSVAMIQRPELYGAVVAAEPLTDMLRYPVLTMGALWLDEYGDPARPVDRAVLASYSPLHTVRADRRYPPLLLTTARNDDRVHPGHARKLAARMQAQGHTVYLYEAPDGGHDADVTPAHAARRWATIFTFLWQELGGAAPGAAAQVRPR